MASGEIRGRHLDIPYTLSSSFDADDGLHLAHLQLPGLPPLPWRPFMPGSTPEAVEAELPLLTDVVHDQIERALDTEREIQQGWAAEVPGRHAQVFLHWLFQRAERHKQPVQSFWVECPCGNTRSRFRYDPAHSAATAYSVISQGDGFDWDREGVPAVAALWAPALLALGPARRAGMAQLGMEAMGEVIQQTLQRTRGLAGVQGLPTASTEFERHCASFSEVFGMIRTENEALHEQRQGQMEALRGLMAGQLSAVLEAWPISPEVNRGDAQAGEAPPVYRPRTRLPPVAPLEQLTLPSLARRAAQGLDPHEAGLEGLSVAVFESGLDVMAHLTGLMLTREESSHWGWVSLWEGQDDEEEDDGPPMALALVMHGMLLLAAVGRLLSYTRTGRLRKSSAQALEYALYDTDLMETEDLNFMAMVRDRRDGEEPESWDDDDAPNLARALAMTGRLHGFDPPETEDERTTLIGQLTLAAVQLMRVVWQDNAEEFALVIMAALESMRLSADQD